MKTTYEYARFVVLLLCVGLTIWAGAVMFDYVLAHNVTGELNVDAFIFLLIGFPFFAVVRFLWNRLEDQNYRWHIQRSSK